MQRVLAPPCDEGEARTSSAWSEGQNCASSNCLVFQGKMSSSFSKRIHLFIFCISNTDLACSTPKVTKASILDEAHSGLRCTPGCRSCLYHPLTSAIWKTSLGHVLKLFPVVRKRASLVFLTAEQNNPHYLKTTVQGHACAESLWSVTGPCDIYPSELTKGDPLPSLLLQGSHIIVPHGPRVAISPVSYINTTLTRG